MFRDPSHLLLSENGDLSFLLCFSKQCLEENIQGKLKKKPSVTFNFWGITLSELRDSVQAETNVKGRNEEHVATNYNCRVLR